MPDSKQKLEKFLQLVNNYPSPHNGQPIRLKLVDDNKIELYFEKSRGLQASEVSFIFSFVSMGIFVEYLKSCAKALGHRAQVQVSLPKENELKGEGIVTFGSVRLDLNAVQSDGDLRKALAFRQTSRKKYTRGLDELVSKDIIEIARRHKMQLTQLNPEQTKGTIWLNQRAVFDDLFDDAVRDELKHWLRFSKKEKLQKMDGLSYDCMELNGSLLRFIVEHRRLLRAPVVSSLLKHYYLSTMNDKSSAYYMLAPFQTETESFSVGEVIMKIWLRISQDKKYIHPFGTIMSNQAAHKDFLDLAGIRYESRDRSYLVFIFRAGASSAPVRSLRLLPDKHLIMEDA